MAKTPRDQPSGVATTEPERPTDEHVVTTDTPLEVQESSEADPNAKAAAAKPGGSNEQKPAPATTKRKPRRDKSAEGKIHKLTAMLDDSGKTIEANTAEIAELREQVEALEAATPEVPEPKLDDFKTPQEYAKAYAKWSKPAAKPKPKPAPAPAAKPAASTEPAPAAADPEIVDFRKRGTEKLGDEFVEALQVEGQAVNQLMGEFIFDSEFGPEIYVHLSNNQTDARKIYDASSRRAITALEALEVKAKAGELDVGEGQLSIQDPAELDEHDTGPAKTTKAAPTKTKAPTPPSSTKDGASVNLAKDPEKESMDEYGARRAKEEAVKAGRILN